MFKYTLKSCKAILIASLFSIALSGCAVTPMLEKMDISSGDNLKEIDLIYGPPFRVEENLNQYVARYYFGKSELNPSAYIPLIGAVAGTTGQEVYGYDVTYSNQIVEKVNVNLMKDSTFKMTEALAIYSD